jgi:hypothetical protein
MQQYLASSFDSTHTELLWKRAEQKRVIRQVQSEPASLRILRFFELMIM